MVAHRLSTLRGMDKIIVLEEGRVVEEGGFAELLERDGVFAEMARKQGWWPVRRRPGYWGRPGGAGRPARCGVER